MKLCDDCHKEMELEERTLIRHKYLQSNKYNPHTPIHKIVCNECAEKYRPLTVRG